MYMRPSVRVLVCVCASVCVCVVCVCAWGVTDHTAVSLFIYVLVEK